MSEQKVPDQVIQENAVNLSLSRDQYLESIKGLVELMKLVISEDQKFRDLAISNQGKEAAHFSPSIPGGWFYEHSFNEHINLYLHFAGLSEHFKELIEAGEFVETAIQAKPIEPPDWVDSEDSEARMAVMFTALYTMQMSIRTIDATGWPINHFIEEGRKGDRTMLKRAVRHDALAITSPTVAAEIMKSDILDKGKFRNDLKSALRSPRKPETVNHGMLRYVLRIMHDDGMLEQMSGEDRYEFFCKELGLYPDRNFEAEESLNRFIRECVSNFRT